MQRVVTASKSRYSSVHALHGRRNHLHGQSYCGVHMGELVLRQRGLHFDKGFRQLLAVLLVAPSFEKPS